MPEPILVTGGTGFIGRHLVPHLVTQGHAVRALVRAGSDPGSVAALQTAGAETVHGDLVDWDSLTAAVDGCRRVVHLANLYSLWERDPSVYQRVNVEGTRRVAQAAAEAGVELFLHVSSVVAFGRPAEVPFHERCAPGPERFSAYAHSKYQADRVVESFAVSHRLPVAILYPGSVLGPGDRKASGRYIQDILEGRMPAELFGEDVMTWVHVRDVVDAVARLLARPDAAGARYLVGRHRLTLHQLNRLIEETGGVRAPRFALPDWAARFTAGVLTTASAVTGRPPPWNLSRDMARTLSHSVQADGSRIERELGLRYTEIRTAVAEAVAELQGAGPPP